MDLKTDDILNVDDSDLLLCYDLDKLNLDSITNDILDFTDDISKTDNSSEVQNDGEDVKTTVVVNSDSSEKSTTKSPIAGDESKKVTIAEVKTKTPSKNIKRKIDINGNEEISSCDNLNELFVKLELSDSKNKDADDKELSDSENEEADDKELSDSENEEPDEKASTLTERGGPIRPSKRASRNRRQKDTCNTIENHNRTQFDPQRLRFWSGSSQLIQSTTLSVPVGNSLTPIFCGSAVAHTSTTQDFYDDSRAQSVSSPESGYDSSATSITGSPPPRSVYSPLNLDLIAETDEQNIFDFLIENTDSALLSNSPSASDLDSSDPQGKITEIINFLKDTPGELNKSSSAIVGLVEDSIPDNVPLVNNAGDLNTSPVMLPPVLTSLVSKNVETPKKLVYKLQDKAKKELYKFLSKNEYHAVRDAIYKRINKDIANLQKDKVIYKRINKDIANQEDVKVIHVENETDKTSENKTNLHLAVLNGNIEQIYSLVEIHKQYGLPLSDINIRDKCGKTALDYAIKNGMTLVVDYLKENTACQSVNI